MSNHTVLAFDVGGTKTAWAEISEEGVLKQQGSFPTPQDRKLFLAELQKVVQKHDSVAAIGIGIAGTVSADHRGTLVCTNIPGLSHLELCEIVESTSGKPVALDNDGRCALIGEAWLGAAKDTSSAVLITLGTGVGGAVMQRHNILPHPTDLSREISHLPADPCDLFPASSGRGTVEALIGGKNIEERYGVKLNELAADMRAEKPDAEEFWGYVHEAFMQCIRAIYDAYNCRMIIVGGRGVADLNFYLAGTKTPCPIIPAYFGAQSGLYGAARLALDAAEESGKDWDEA